MKQIKKIFKNRIFIFILGGLIFGTVGVYAATYFPSNNVTYDNSESGLTSTDVQGAIDELYLKAFPKVPEAGGTPIDIVTSGDGLYKDEYEDGKYTYKGANPNNYVTFNNEYAGWRIISIEDDTFKLIRNNSIGEQYLDGEWKDSTAQTYLNGTYYNSLNSTVQSQIITHDWNVGENISMNPMTPNEIQTDLVKLIDQEKLAKWNGKVGLISISEYIRANSNLLECETWWLHSSLNRDTCIATNWMYYSSGTWWTMIHFNDDTNSAYLMATNGNIGYNNAKHEKYALRPVVYLSKDVKITGGYGTQDNPYRIE